MPGVAIDDNGSPREEGSAENILEVARARRAFADRQVLTGVDLALTSHEIYCLLGPNGAGKTSLVRAISGRLRLDSGSVRVCGDDPAIDPSARRAVGLVPQEIALYLDLTARENLEIFARLMGVSRADAQSTAPELLDRIGLADRADDRVGSLSGGMKRRLNVAAGVIHRPRLLLLDEPTVGVDPAARERIHDLLADLRREGLAILLTTHDLDQAAALADRVGMLIEGSLQAEGAVEDLVHEFFGDGKELLVCLRRPPAKAHRAHLLSKGLEPASDDRIWTSRLTPGQSDVATVSAAFEAAGLDVEEIRVREPSLRGVFFKLAGREIDA
jgi:ABC-2 type transport system ATP-binding protein